MTRVNRNDDIIFLHIFLNIFLHIFLQIILQTFFTKFFYTIFLQIKKKKSKFFLTPCCWHLQLQYWSFCSFLLILPSFYIFTMDFLTLNFGQLFHLLDDELKNIIRNFEKKTKKLYQLNMSSNIYICHIYMTPNHQTYIYIHVSLKIMPYLLLIKTLCAFSNFLILNFISVGSINKICPKFNSSWLFSTHFAISLGIIRSPVRWGVTN